jgi:hypothetical protein
VGGDGIGSRRSRGYAEDNLRRIRTKLHLDYSLCMQDHGRLAVRLVRWDLAVQNLLVERQANCPKVSGAPWRPTQRSVLMRGMSFCRDLHQMSVRLMYRS